MNLEGIKRSQENLINWSRKYFQDFYDWEESQFEDEEEEED